MLYTCAIAEAVIVPVLVAVLFGLMLAPPVRLLERSRVPRAIGSLLMVLLAIAIIGGAITALASPAREWVGAHAERARAHRDRDEAICAVRSRWRPRRRASSAR